MSAPTSRSESYGQRGLTPVDRFGVWLSRRKIMKSIPMVPSLMILDCGCGYHAEMLSTPEPGIRRGVGIDISIDPALKSEGGLEFIESTLENALPGLAAESFDVILLISVLEHLTVPEEILAHAHRLLRPGAVCSSMFPPGEARNFLSSWLSGPASVHGRDG